MSVCHDLAAGKEGIRMCCASWRRGATFAGTAGRGAPTAGSVTRESTHAPAEASETGVAGLVPGAQVGRHVIEQGAQLSSGGVRGSSCPDHAATGDCLAG